MNIREFSAQVSYSSATILRFCRKLGYSGFAEFKYQLRHQNTIHDLPSSPEKKPDFDIQKLMDSMCFNIDGTAGLISEEQLSRTFHYLDSDCPIYVWAPADLRLSSAITLKNCCFPSEGKMYICWNPPKCPPTSCKTRKISVF